MYRIITDTSANLELELLERKGIAEIPFSFSMPEKGGDALYCPDFSAFDSKAFYDAMRSGTRVTTSQITPAQYTEKMRPLLEAGQDILFIGMSSGVSGSFQAGMVAAAQLRAEFPERSIELIDTLGASLGEGLVVLRAAELRDSGIALSAAVHLLSDYRDRMCQVFTVDNLKYLCSTGRLSNAKAAIGNILNIKPLLKGDSEGKIVNFGKVRGRKNSLRAIAEQYREYVVDAANQTVGIAHADCIEDANTLAELISEIAPPKDILTVMYEAVTGSHVGPGTLALFFVGKKGFRQAKS